MLWKVEWALKGMETILLWKCDRLYQGLIISVVTLLRSNSNVSCSNSVFASWRGRGGYISATE